MFIRIVTAKGFDCRFFIAEKLNWNLGQNGFILQKVTTYDILKKINNSYTIY